MFRKSAGVCLLLADRQRYWWRLNYGNPASFVPRAIPLLLLLSPLMRRRRAPRRKVRSFPWPAWETAGAAASRRMGGVGRFPP